jgi:tellurite resistance-related uncharacterized protein
MSVPTAPSSKVPYKCTPIFDETTLPAGLRREHRTKAGVWGVIRVLEGRLRYRVLEPNSEVILEPAIPGSSCQTIITPSRRTARPDANAGRILQSVA